MHLRNGKLKPTFDVLDEYRFDHTYNTRSHRIKSEPPSPEADHDTESNTSFEFISIVNDAESSCSWHESKSARQEPSNGSFNASHNDSMKNQEQNSIYQPPIDMKTLQRQLTKFKAEKMDNDDDDDDDYGDDDEWKYVEPKRRASKRPRASPRASGKVQTYCCYLCGKSFQHFCRLKAHMLTHTGEKPFPCDLCTKAYCNLSSVNVHKRVVHFGMERPQRKRRTTRAQQRRKSGYRRQPTRRAKVNENKENVRPNLAACMPINRPIKEENMEWIDIETVPAEDERKFHQFLDVNDGLVKFDDALQPDLDLPTVEFTPFVWNEQDLKAKVGYFGDEKENDGPQAPNLLNMNGELGSRPRNKSKFGIFRQKTPKIDLWQKESNHFGALHVDIFQYIKPKSTSKSLLLSTEISKQLNVDASAPKSNKKNIELAIEYLKTGDNDFKQKNWQDARQWYNRALAHAETNSIHTAIACAKRAQCFFNLEMYRRCWIDLKLAERIGLPKQMLPLLHKHKQACQLKLRENMALMDVEPQLSCNPSPLFPEMVNDLQIAWNEENGRHIVARDSIGVGQIVMIEKGFVATTTQNYEKCCVCLDGDVNLIPCPRCTSAMLCKRCFNEKFHVIECELQSQSGHDWLPKAGRSILNAMMLFPNVDEMMNFVADAIAAPPPHLPTDVQDLKAKYRAFLQLACKPNLNPQLVASAFRVQASILKHSFFQKHFNCAKHHRFLSHLLVHHIAVTGQFATKTHDQDGRGCIEVTAPISSYINHSCAPNASKFLLGDTVIVVAMRPIAKGQQLLVSYCSVLSDKIERQNFLRANYGFQCKCERCTASVWTSTGIPNANHFAQTSNQCFGAEISEQFVKENFAHLVSNNQEKRRALSDRVHIVLQQLGHLPWNYTINWAFIVFSLLLSHRFQRKLQY